MKTGRKWVESGNNRPSKVLVIGLDGATFNLVGPLMQEGKLPNLSKMAARGVHGKLYSTILPLSPSAWTSFATGKNPGKHGIYDFSKIKQGTYDHVPTTSLDGRSETLWDLVGKNGGRSIVVNVPLTYPPKPLSGVMISGFPTPVARRDFTYPTSLLAELESRFGEVGIHKPPVLYRKGKEREITDRLIKITRQQAAITRYLMESSKWDLAVSVFDATDVASHYFWAYLDKNHPKYDPALAGTVQQMVEEIHVELDAAIGKIFEASDEDTLKMVISDHGFGPVYYGVYMNNWLLEQNYMKFKNTPIVRVKYWTFRHGLHTYNLLQFAKKFGLVKSIESAYATKSLMLNLVKKTALSMDDIDWDQTSVYSFGNLGQFYINMRGREPNGIVNQKDAEGLVRELVVKLKLLEDPTTHEHLFDHVYAKSDIFLGDASIDAPDIVFFDEEMKYSAHRMFELGSNKLVTPHPVYSGNHKMDGILFAEGRGIKPLREMSQTRSELVDLAPTILRYLGDSIPSDIDGRVLYSLFSDDLGFAEPQATQSVQTERRRIELGIRNLKSKKKI